MSAHAVVRVRTRHTNGSLTFCVPKKMAPIWLLKADYAQVYVTEDGGVHLVPTSEEYTTGRPVITREKQIKGTYWGPNR